MGNNDYDMKPFHALIFFFALSWCLLVHADTLPGNMYADSLHAPFYHGVASGDPLSDRVLIWTRITPPNPAPDSIAVTWEMATDTLFTASINSGIYFAKAVNDWTVIVDVANLNAASTYYYRFQSPDGSQSIWGRTKTAPDGDVDQLKIAVASCSSIYSGYFNAYRRIAERNDLDLVIHLGDYLYDFVDGDEEVRVPDPYPQEPDNLVQWRERHRYYLLDPDLRKARRMHPWMVMWDNHDTQGDNTLPDALISIQAFQEYIPMRLPDASQPAKAYRSLHYGNLAHLIMTDILLYRGIDEIMPDEYSILGNEQYAWLTNELDNSQAQWRIIGSQNMMGGWSSEGLPDIPQIPTNGEVFDASSWDGYQEDRARVLDHLEDNGIDNNVVLSGDAHISMAMDLIPYPFDSIQYNPETGEGAVGVEFLPSSITRGNVDETGIAPSLGDALAAISQNLNPHHVYTELISHGYGLLAISPDTVIADFWYSDILAVTETETLGERLMVLNGENHWHRQETAISPDDLRNLQNEKIWVSEVFPNPVSQDGFYIDTRTPLPQHIQLEILDLQGKQIHSLLQQQLQANKTERLYVDLKSEGLPSGYYLLAISGDGFELTRLFLLENR